MTAQPVDNRVGQFPGSCFRCGEYGHKADDDAECRWLQKAATPKEHQARIDSLTMRFLDEEIGPWLKREYIRHENKLWRGKA
jgi:hypothetical protein